MYWLYFDSYTLARMVVGYNRYLQLMEHAEAIRKELRRARVGRFIETKRVKAVWPR